MNSVTTGEGLGESLAGSGEGINLPSGRTMGEVTGITRGARLTGNSIDEALLWPLSFQVGVSRGSIS